MTESIDARFDDLFAPISFGGGGADGPSDEDHVNRSEKSNRLGYERDGLTDKGRNARDRDPDGNFGANDHTWSTICGSCHSSDPGRYSNQSR